MLLSILLFGILTCLVGCNMSENTEHSSSDVGTTDSAQEQIQPQRDREKTSVQTASEPYTKDTSISDVMNDPVFGATR
jgi:outer membrane murein-binding lipoprotein Lpp